MRLMAMLALSAVLAGPVPGRAQSAADSANARFMAGMIGHHRQALLMAGWIPSHGGSSQLRVLGERIIVSQRDEIALMERWLRSGNWPAPDSNEHDSHASHALHDMPGMLSRAQLTQLDSARGVEFDRMFLLLMIQHHRGAITMVERLRATPGGAQDPLVLSMANDISADQAAEIHRMGRMMASLPSPRSNQ